MMRSLQKPSSNIKIFPSHCSKLKEKSFSSVTCKCGKGTSTESQHHQSLLLSHHFTENYLGWAPVKKIKGERGRHRIKNWDFTVASGISLGVILQVCPEFLKPPFFFLLLAIKLYIPTTFKHVVSAGCRTDGAVFRLAVLGSEHAPFEEVRCR